MSGSITWISCIAILLVFWLILIRPQRKKEKQVATMRRAVKAGDKILTIGGIKCRVIKAKEESLIVEAGDKVRMEIMRWAVSQVLEEGKGSIRKEAAKEIEEKASKEAEDIVANAEAEVEAERAEAVEEAAEAKDAE